MTFYRRNLPHWHPEGKIIFITWRLYGSLPGGSTAAKVAKSIVATSTAKSGCVTGKQFVILDRYLDFACTGPRWLADGEIAACVEDTIFRGVELGHYGLYAYVLMPNHVHVLLQPLAPLARITAGIKGVSARNANARLGRVGKHFWQDESFDHWVRNSAEFERIQRYIEWNPVKAGLVTRPEDWRWSSAHPEASRMMAKLAQRRASIAH